MAHSVKYYKDFVSQGKQWRIDIAQETTNPFAPMEIGPVLQGLRLIVQGDQADIDTPILKTSLEMTFVDAPDYDYDLKCGYWEEFYTASATEYKVVLWKEGSPLWSGFITPDSFSEDLRYRGSVTIVARDNLGHLQDFMFDLQGDENGMVSLLDIVNGAERKELSMPIRLSEGDAYNRIWIKCADGYASSHRQYNILFNASAFRDKTWWEALESALYATGCVMRYTENGFDILPIRCLGLGNNTLWVDVPRKEVQFVSYGHRELSPAAKTIKEEVKYDIQESIGQISFPESTYGESGECYFGEYKDIEADNPEQVNDYYYVPVHAYSAPQWGGVVTADKSCLLNPYAFPLKQGYSGSQYGEIYSDEVLYILANPVEPLTLGAQSRSVTYRTWIKDANFEIALTFGHPVTLFDDMTKIGNFPGGFFLRPIELKCEFTRNDGVVYYLSSQGWTKTPTQARYLCSGSLGEPRKLPVLSIGGSGSLKIEIFAPQCEDMGNTNYKGAYFRIQEVAITPTNKETMLLDSLKTTTNYSAKNNIVLNRNPEFGINDSGWISPEQVTNGLFTKGAEYYSSQNWYWHSTDSRQPLSVLIHQQILAFYSKPNNVLTGELVTKDPTFDALYKWNGKDHLLMSGTLNILSGHMENAVLREFKRYDHMWETWVEREYFDIQGDEATYNTFVHSNKPITSADIKYLPSWATATIYQTVTSGLYGLTIQVQGNYTSEVRRGIFNVDTAFVVIDQRPAGDYGSDYYFDYS
jgi:hypothetical protein